MHLPTLISLALPALAAAQQIPLLDQAKSLFASLTGRPLSTVARPVTETVSRAGVTDLTLENWRDTLTHKGAAKEGDDPEAWMVYITGRNKSCHGLCGKMDAAWDEAATYLLAYPSAPFLARLDCDDQELLCGAWAVAVATVQVFQIPHPTPNQTPAPTILTVHYLNATSATVNDITSIVTEKQYLDPQFRYEGLMHPYDGWVAKNGFTMPVAYFLYATAKVPSWAFMIGLSIFSRYWVSRRTAGGVPPFSRPNLAAKGPAVPAPAAAAAAAKKKR